MKRIHICGIYGSGKSTLARYLSRKLNILHYSLDDIKYEIKYRKIRPVEERISRVKEICKGDAWITEGTWSNYAEEAFKKCDLVVHLLPPKLTLYCRIMKRYFLRKKEKSDTFLNACKLVLQARKYHHTHEPVSLAAHRALIKKYNKKYVLVRTGKELQKFLSDFFYCFEKP